MYDSHDQLQKFWKENFLNFSISFCLALEKQQSPSMDLLLQVYTNCIFFPPSLKYIFFGKCPLKFHLWLHYSSLLCQQALFISCFMNMAPVSGKVCQSHMHFFFYKKWTRYLSNYSFFIDHPLYPHKPGGQQNRDKRESQSTRWGKAFVQDQAPHPAAVIGSSASNAMSFTN